MSYNIERNKWYLLEYLAAGTRDVITRLLVNKTCKQDQSFYFQVSKYNNK